MRSTFRHLGTLGAVLSLIAGSGCATTSQQRPSAAHVVAQCGPVGQATDSVLAVVVKDVTGASIPGVLVAFELPGVQPVVTDSEGAVRIPVPANAKGELRVSMPGFLDLTQTVRTGPGCVTTADVILEVLSIDEVVYLDCSTPWPAAMLGHH